MSVKENEPLVSIIMPAYNSENYIQESIDSIINQSYQNWELLIADDCSTDRTKEVIEQYGKKDNRIKIFNNTKNMGPFPTRNKLLEKALGQYITFQDADDLSLPERLEKQVDIFKEDSDVGIVGTWGKVISENNKVIDVIERPINDKDIKKRNFISNTFISASVMITREVYQKVGGFRPYLYGFGCQDYDWTSIISEQYKSKNIDEPLYLYRQVTTSVSKTIDPRRQVSEKLVHFLMQIRKENDGKDYLHTGEISIVNDYLKKLLDPYQKDPTLVYREYASKYMYAGLEKSAIKVSWQAIQKEPLKVINWRTLFYCVRKSLL